MEIHPARGWCYVPAMSAFLGYLANALARPSVALTLIALAGLVCLFARRAILARVLLVSGIGCQALLLALPVDQWIARPLEDWYPQRHEAPARVDGIVVLGGAVRPWIAGDRGTPGLNSAAERMTTFVALARQHPEARLVFTGGMGWMTPGGTTEADAARLFFADFGLADRVVYEAASDNTWENAVLTRDLVRPRPGETWLLVTSALHMPRAVATFRAAGWEVEPWPSAYRTRRHFAWRLSLELADRLELLDSAAHEWLGLLAYRLRGRAVAPADGPAPQ
ncbi:YdcF family protein [Rhodovastum atsumiense]|uniref:YdcF family protein n=2 Tax=Rhodovastum atsumiense TaxID=504468 RepID=A0A5M6IR64_9PROT|nr:YdcF family protein [Rhodovastum atsumiense]